MTEDLIVQHCSPTLAGLKTGNMFSVSFDSGDDMVTEMRRINRILTRRGLRAIPFRTCRDSWLVYIFRPDCLKRDLAAPEALDILKEKGYRVENPACCLAQLAEKICEHQEFPHEIGLFLGYPPEDVRGFIDSCCKKCGASRGAKFTGYWKVYGDEQEASRRFARFDKCIKAYRDALGHGRTLEQLIVKGSAASAVK